MIPQKDITGVDKFDYKKNRLLIYITVASVLEALRRYPHKQDLFCELSTVGSHSTSTTQPETDIQLHAPNLVQLSKENKPIKK